MPKLFSPGLAFLAFTTLFFLACKNEPSQEKSLPPASTSGHQRMIAILDSIAVNADPDLCYHLNTRKAEMIRQQIEADLPPDQLAVAKFKYGEQLLYAGKTEAATIQFAEAVTMVQNQMNEGNKVLFELLALSYLRLGEQQNCIQQHNAESCILPIQGEGVYKFKSGPETAIKIYEQILTAFPEDLQTRWLLNIAYMNLGLYPDGVPAKWLVPTRLFESKGDLKFRDIAIPLGLDVMGLSGGVCIEDFDQDGNLDLFMTSYGLSDPVRFFKNNGDGTFTERTHEANLDGIVSGLNTLHADYDNDGDRDVFILRGGWLAGGTHPNSLLRNNGDGTFTDVTIEAGLLSFHPTQTGVWMDFDADGWLDLYIANESFPGKTFHPNELYKNNRNGTFTNVASPLKVDFQSYYKGCAAGDVNNDRLPDIFLSNMAGANNLLINRGNGVFEDVAVRAGVINPQLSFPTWLFDYDSDGLEDIVVVGYGLNLQQDAAGDLLRDYLGQQPEGDWFRLYHNDGNEKFTDVAKQAGLDKITYAMGCNFGDLDNDGWLDFYLGTGKPDFRSLVPNRMFRNVAGKRFEEISMNGFAHIQKGHGVAFGDIDNDGDQDIYEVMGGAFEGDISANLLFENPGTQGNHWINIELEGTTCNRDAIGSKIAVNVIQKGGAKRTIWMSVSTGASFGSASLRQEIGLGPAEKIESVEVRWAQPGPAKSVYTDVPMDRFIKIKEGSDKVTVLDRMAIVLKGSVAAKAN